MSESSVSSGPPDAQYHAMSTRVPQRSASNTGSNVGTSVSSRSTRNHRNTSQNHTAVQQPSSSMPQTSNAMQSTATTQQRSTMHHSFATPPSSPAVLRAGATRNSLAAASPALRRSDTARSQSGSMTPPPALPLRERPQAQLHPQAHLQSQQAEYTARQQMPQQEHTYHGTTGNNLVPEKNKHYTSFSKTYLQHADDDMNRSYSLAQYSTSRVNNNDRHAALYMRSQSAQSHYPSHSHAAYRSSSTDSSHRYHSDSNRHYQGDVNYMCDQFGNVSLNNSMSGKPAVHSYTLPRANSRHQASTGQNADRNYNIHDTSLNQSFYDEIRTFEYQDHNSSLDESRDYSNLYADAADEGKKAAAVSPSMHVKPALRSDDARSRNNVARNLNHSFTRSNATSQLHQLAGRQNVPQQAKQPKHKIEQYKIDTKLQAQAVEESDSVTQFCTEGTPYGILSKASSMSDLVDELEGSRDLEFAKYSHNSTNYLMDNYNTYVTRNTSALPPVTQAANVMLDAADESRIYCEEGTPATFSRVSSLSSLHGGNNPDESLRTNDTSSDIQNTSNPVELEANDTLCEDSATKKDSASVYSSHSSKGILNQLPLSNATGASSSTSHHATLKSVTFDESSCHQTPMMFSRSSSLESLSSLDGQSVHSSVISEYSRRASEVVSPSDLPDSPSETVPPSPPAHKTRHDSARPYKPLASLENYQQDNINSDACINYAKTLHYQDKPKQVKDDFSCATSLSALSIDDDDDFKITKDPGLPKIALQGEEDPSDVVVKPAVNPPVDEAKSSVNDDDVLDSDSSDDSTNEELLAECIKQGMPPRKPNSKMRRSISDSQLKQKQHSASHTKKPSSTHSKAGSSASQSSYSNVTVSHATNTQMLLSQKMKAGLPSGAPTNQISGSVSLQQLPSMKGDAASPTPQQHKVSMHRHPQMPSSTSHHQFSPRKYPIHQSGFHVQSPLYAAQYNASLYGQASSPSSKHHMPVSNPHPQSPSRQHVQMMMHSPSRHLPSSCNNMPATAPYRQVPSRPSNTPHSPMRSAFSPVSRMQRYASHVPQVPPPVPGSVKFDDLFSSSGEDEDILMQVIKSALPKKTRRSRKSGSGKAQMIPPVPNVRPQELRSRLPRPPVMPASPLRIFPMKVQSISDPEDMSDAVRCYAVEDTPINFSRATSLSDISDLNLSINQNDTLLAFDASTNTIVPSNDDTNEQDQQSDEPSTSNRASPIVYGMEDTMASFNSNDSISSYNSDDYPHPDVPKSDIPDGSFSDTELQVAQQSIRELDSKQQSAAASDAVSPVSASTDTQTHDESSASVMQSLDNPNSQYPKPGADDPMSLSNQAAKLHVPSALPPSSDAAKKYYMEGTPTCFSRNSSLSSLNSSGEHKDDNIEASLNMATIVDDNNDNDSAEAIFNQSRTFKVEDTPLCFSHNSSLSSLSSDSLDFETSALDAALLDECISMGMPKSKRSNHKK